MLGWEPPENMEVVPAEGWLQPWRAPGKAGNQQQLGRLLGRLARSWLWFGDTGFGPSGNLRKVPVVPKGGGRGAGEPVSVGRVVGHLSVFKRPPEPSDGDGDG